MSDEKKTSLKQHIEAARETLLQAVEGLSGEEWNIQVQGDGDQWTVLQMLRHLQDAQKGLTGQIKRLMEGGETVPRDFDINRWNARIQSKTAEAQMTAEEALVNLKSSLENLMSLIDSIKDEDWGRVGWQPGFQKEYPLEQLVEIIGSHEATHAQEIAAAVTKAKQK